MPMNNRIVDHPILGKLSKKEKITFTFDGKTFEGYEGDTIASALLANGIRTLRVHEESGTPRGIYCNIGHCFECRVTVNGEQGVRACLTPIIQDMQIKSGQTEPNPLDPESKVISKTYAEYEKLTEGDSDE